MVCQDLLRHRGCGYNIFENLQGRPWSDLVLKSVCYSKAIGKIS